MHAVVNEDDVRPLFRRARDGVRGWDPAGPWRVGSTVGAPLAAGQVRVACVRAVMLQLRTLYVLTMQIDVEPAWKSISTRKTTRYQEKTSPAQ
jgi:hypothetical protein